MEQEEEKEEAEENGSEEEQDFNDGTISVVERHNCIRPPFRISK